MCWAVLLRGLFLVHWCICIFLPNGFHFCPKCPPRPLLSLSNTCQRFLLLGLLSRAIRLLSGLIRLVLCAFRAMRLPMRARVFFSAVRFFKLGAL